MTLRDGVAALIMDEIPEIKDVRLDEESMMSNLY